MIPGTRSPFQGELMARVVPRAKALGCSVFALRARQNVQTLADPPERSLPNLRQNLKQRTATRTIRAILDN
jgi:hypothetical protein